MPMDLGTSSSDNREDKTAMKKLPIASAASLAAQQPVASPVTPSKDQEMILTPVDKETTAPRETNGGEKPPIHLVATEPQEVSFQPDPADAMPKPPIFNIPVEKGLVPSISSLSLDTMTASITNRAVLHAWIGNTYHQSVGHLTAGGADQFLAHVNFTIAACTKLQAILEAFAAARDGADNEYTFFRNPFPGVILDTSKENDDTGGVNIVALVEEIAKNCKGEGCEIEIEALCIEWIDTYSIISDLFGVMTGGFNGGKHIVKLPHFNSIVENQPVAA